MPKRKNSSDSNKNDAKRGKSSPELDLQELLDISSLSDLEGISVRFDKIAEALLQTFMLVLTTYRGGETDTCFRILELEFYLWKPQCHEDPFTHGSEEQRSSGQWYFHRVPRSTTQSTQNPTHSTGYRGGSRKGLDLTFGGPVSSVTSPYFQAGAGPSSDFFTSNLRGGILLRSIQRVQDGKVISGPSLLVDELLSVTKASNISDLVQKQWNGDIACFSARRPVQSSSRLTLRLFEPSHSEQRPTVYKSPRIGLDLSNPQIPLTPTTPSHPRIVFVSKPYRYFTHPNLLVANGRHQTFLGVLFSLKSFPIIHGHAPVPDEMVKSLSAITGIRGQTVRTYLSHFMSGFGHDDDGGAESDMPKEAVFLPKDFLGAAGKGVSSSAERYLKMMGCLIRMTECSVSSELGVVNSGA
ncbi:hypothetical protein D9758_007720 [Tetrapyrgos nigripes]|uniref:Uncharacterized protein n=1 Tax=Tetrapyrgos nigripes TaxID=182062 RepID=A0A8H5LIT7_9AGAR|nr:hypothetical protein D9758_007720 [Tetrapyrgos nigripes]